MSKKCDGKRNECAFFSSKSDFAEKEFELKDRSYYAQKTERKICLKIPFKRIC